MNLKPFTYASTIFTTFYVKVQHSKHSHYSFTFGTQYIIGMTLVLFVSTLHEASLACSWLIPDRATLLNKDSIHGLIYQPLGTSLGKYLACGIMGQTFRLGEEELGVSLPDLHLTQTCLVASVNQLEHYQKPLSSTYAFIGTTELTWNHQAQVSKGI